MEHYAAVCSLLKTALWGPERCPLEIAEGTDWAAVSKELSDHAVDALVMDILPGVPGEIRQELLFKATRRMAVWHRLIREQDALGALFREAGIPFLLLKGTAAAIYYPQPEYRAMGDIDVIVLPADFQRAYGQMEEAGYVLHSDHERAREAVFVRNGVTVELHRYYAVMDDKILGKALDEKILEEIPRAQEASIGGHSFPMLSGVTNGLVLLTHINQHISHGLGLRQIIDWMLYVDRALGDDQWRNFAPQVRALGLEKLAVTVTRMCQLYLGLREENITWCAGADEALCHRLMEVTMDRGDFARKHTLTRKTIRVTQSVTGLPSLFRQLQTRGCYNWKLLRKYPALKPFAWIYQLFRYLYYGLTRGNPIQTLRQDLELRRQEEALWDQLGVTRRRRR